MTLAHAAAMLADALGWTLHAGPPDVDRRPVGWTLTAAGRSFTRTGQADHVIPHLFRDAAEHLEHRDRQVCARLERIGWELDERADRIAELAHELEQLEARR